MPTHLFWLMEHISPSIIGNVWSGLKEILLFMVRIDFGWYLLKYVVMNALCSPDPQGQQPRLRLTRALLALLPQVLQLRGSTGSVSCELSHCWVASSNAPKAQSCSCFPFCCTRDKTQGCGTSSPSPASSVGNSGEVFAAEPPLRSSSSS